MLTAENLKAMGFKNLKRIGDDFMMSCPFHEDQNPSFGIEVTSGRWHCFSCGRSGKDITSLSKLLNLPELEKHFNYTTYSDLSRKVLDRISPKKDLSSKLNDLEYLVDYYKSYYNHEYLESRGVSKEIADKFNIGYDKEKNALTFPVYTVDNKFLGFTYRYLDGILRYKHEFNKSNTLYGANFLIKDNIIVVEGNIDVLKAYSLGFKNIVALMGTKINGTQIKLLKKYGNSIILALDNDYKKLHNWGRMATTKIVKKLLPIFGDRLYIGEYSKNSKDFGDLNTKEEFKITAYINWRLKNIE